VKDNLLAPQNRNTIIHLFFQTQQYIMIILIGIYRLQHVTCFKFYIKMAWWWSNNRNLSPVS